MMVDSILVVDDNITNIEMAISLLTPLDYQISFAMSAKEAFEYLEDHDVDLVLLDLEMPDMDGFEMSVRLREDGFTAPIIFSTNRNDSGQIMQAFESGGNDFVTKPFKPTVLIARIKHQLELKKTKEALSAKVESELAKQKALEHCMIDQGKLAQMGEMFVMITHQWIQPLSAITLTCTKAEVDINMDHCSPDRMLETIHDITMYCEHLTHTISDFKLFFKAEKRFVVVNIAEIIDRVLLLAQQRIDYLDVNVFYDPTIIIKINTVKNELIQAMLIIIQNALDVFEEQKTSDPTLTVDITEDDVYVMVDIKDNASGIPLEIIDRIFEPNFTTKGEGGSGIGLYMCQVIVEDHCNGKLEVSSDHRGSTFTITLPK